MAKVPPASLKEILGSNSRPPQFVTSVTGEVLVGDEVDDLIRGDGLRSASGSGNGPRSLLKRAYASLPRKSPKKVRREQLDARNYTRVIPQVLGHDSTSYQSDGTAMKAKRGGEVRRKKRVKQRGRANSASSSLNEQPKSKIEAQYHLGKKDAVDGSRGWAAYRDRNRFGSFPIHDPHGDDSGPEL